MAWIEQKNHRNALPLLNALQKAHFQTANNFIHRDDFSSLMNEFKLSPANKIFTLDKFTKEAEITLNDIFELQDIIGTKGIPALLLAVNDNLLLLNHHLYLQDPKSILDAVSIELNR